MLQRFSKVSVFMMMIMLVAIMSACGKTAETPQATSQAQASAAPAGDAGGTVTYKAANGDIQIPKNLQRVVVLADWYVGDFLAVGIKPIAVTQSALDNPFFKGKLDGVENLGDGTSFEKILDLKPDLIVTFDGTENLDKIEKIAPTVAIKYGQYNYKDQLVEIGKMTSKDDKAKQWLADWDKEIAAAKPKVDAAVGGKTVSIINPYAKGLYVFGNTYGRGGEILYNELKLKAPAEVQKTAIDSGTGWAAISMEKLPEYAGDYIFTCAWSGDTSDPNVVYDNSIWKSLPAVKNNKVFQIDPKGFPYNDPVSLEAELAFIVEKLTQQ